MTGRILSKEKRYQNSDTVDAIGFTFARFQIWKLISVVLSVFVWTWNPSRVEGLVGTKNNRLKAECQEKTVCKREDAWSKCASWYGLPPVIVARTAEHVRSKPRA